MGTFCIIGSLVVHWLVWLYCNSCMAPKVVHFFLAIDPLAFAFLRSLYCREKAHPIVPTASCNKALGGDKYSPSFDLLLTLANWWMTRAGRWPSSSLCHEDCNQTMICGFEVIFFDHSTHRFDHQIQTDQARAKSTSRKARFFPTLPLTCSQGHGVIRVLAWSRLSHGADCSHPEAVGGEGHQASHLKGGNAVKS